MITTWPNKSTGANSRPALQFEGRGLRQRALVVERHGRYDGGAAVAQFCRLDMKVRVIPHNPNWSADFAAEAECVRSVLGDVVAAVHHIGSTAIPGIMAKPIIDILLEVYGHQTLDARSSALAQMGYEAKGEFGIPGRRYFRKDSAMGVRTHQIHAFETGSPACERHLAFRDYLIAHPTIAQSYSSLKQRLAASHPFDIEAYMDGKDLFIKEQESKAVAWKKAQQTGCSVPRDSAAGTIRTSVARGR